MANPNVLSSLLRPARSAVSYAGDYAQLEGAQQRNKMAALLYSQEQQKMAAAQEADQAMRQAYATGNPLEAMLKSGIPSVVQGAQAQQAASMKAQSEAELKKAQTGKASAETVAKQLGMMKDLAGSVVANPTAQSAMAALDQWERLTGQDSSADRQMVAGMSPDQVRRWALGKVGEVDKVLPQFQMVNTGQQTVPVDTNAVTNPTPQPLQMSASPGQVLSADTQRRGQNMTDARARQALQQSAQQFNARMAAAAAGGGAGGGGGGKPPTEGERNAGGYLLRMEEASTLLDKFEQSGRPTYGTELAGGIPFFGDAARRLAMSPEQQQYRQAQEDWVRAKLRKESGAAIGVDEMDREIQTYFPQPGDGQAVVKQKRASREVANKAMRAAAGRGVIGEPPQAGKVVDFGSLK